jgi:beta-galactosidase
MKKLYSHSCTVSGSTKSEERVITTDRKRIAGFILIYLFSSASLFAQENVSLNGKWKINTNPPENFWTNTVTFENWTDIQVPGECTTQGYAIKSDKEFAYKKEILIPASFKNKKIQLRFDGVYNYARVWVNGFYIMDHYCGFTTWYCDITKAVKAGQKAIITVAVTDIRNDLSFQSGFSMHFIGGIIGSVSLIALPKDNLRKFYVETDLDKNFQNATLRLTLGMEFGNSTNSTVKLVLKDSKGKKIPINPSEVKIDIKTPEKTIDILVPDPLKWDAEHPNLYILTASVSNESSKEIQTISKRIGFRKIEVIKSKFLVNGKQVKLRGINRLTVHPLTGRTVSPEIDEQDVKLFKQANINFVRACVYPPSEHFLDLCDKYGIYVEEDNAITFLQFDNDFIEYVNDPDYTKKAINQLSEMLERDRNHPAIIIWSIGNESRYGKLFAESYQFLKKNDPTRPVIFSFANSVRQLKGEKCYDILSYHYPNTLGAMGESIYNFSFNGFSNDTIPLLADEYCHVAAYCKFTYELNPGIRDYWGHGLEKFWDNMYHSEGCLGGAIFSGHDEVFMLKDTTVGYGEWGIFDGWRRPKPEFWHVRKGYSPVKVKYDENSKQLTFFNRFDHTNFSEVKAKWSFGDKKGIFNLPAINPNDSCILSVPAAVLANPNGLRIEFYKDTAMFDDYVVTESRKQTIPKPAIGRVDFTEKLNQIEVFSDNFRLIFNKSNGQLTQIIRSKDNTVIGGPYLELGYNSYAPPYEGFMTIPNRRVDESKWVLSEIHTSQQGDNVVIDLAGKYEDVLINSRQTGLIYNVQAVGFTCKVNVSANGTLTFDYEVKVNLVNSNEVGLRFALPKDFNRIEWDRKAQWTSYPSDHIGRPKGIAYKYSKHNEVYRQAPTWNWNEDTYNWYLHSPKKLLETFEPVTNDFKSSKENIYSYTVSNDAGAKITAVANGNVSARTEVLKGGQTFLVVDNKWSYPLGWGSDEGDASIKGNFKGKVTLQIK